MTTASPSPGRAEIPEHDRSPRSRRPAPASAVPPTAASQARAGAPRFDTRRRLFTAFAALAAAFVAAFSSQLMGLRRMEARLAQLQEHDEQARLTVELEHAIESQLDHHAH